MRIAIISDVHSNLEALTTVFGVIDQNNVDKIICLGDIVGYGANPNECIDMIRKRCSIVITGNHDEAVLNLNMSKRFSEDARRAILWTQKRITEDNINYLRTLPLSHSQDNLLFVHASPCNPQDWNYLFDEDTASTAMQCFSESICFIGHTHVPEIFSSSGRTIELTKKDRFLINVGSIGQPRDRNTKLSFGLMDTKTWVYENIRSPYNTILAAQKIFDNNLPSRLGQRILIGV